MFWASHSGPFLSTPPLFLLFLVSNERAKQPLTAVGTSCMVTPALLLLIGMNTENTESQRMTKIMSEIQALQEVVTRFRQMRLDATEFACLKCIVTFKAGQWHRDSERVARRLMWREFEIPPFSTQFPHKVTRRSEVSGMPAPSPPFKTRPSSLLTVTFTPGNIQISQSNNLNYARFFGCFAPAPAVNTHSDSL